MKRTCSSRTQDAKCTYGSQAQHAERSRSSRARRKKPRCFYDVMRNEHGFTTIGAAIAILLSCTLLFFGLFAARSTSRAAAVQAVADAAVLAAENEVSEFVLSVRVADATLLSLSLTGLSLLGIGTVCCCVPNMQAVGTELIDTAQALLEKRDSLADVYETALNVEQDALAITAQAQAQAIISENADEVSGTAIGYIELVPTTGTSVTVGSSDAAASATESLTSQSESIQSLAAQAEDASARAAEAFEEGWLSDCGNSPDACMAERAAALTSMTDAENPIALSANTWSYSMALERTRTYYAYRLAEEEPEDDSVEETVRSILRARLYAYAVELLEDAYVEDDGVNVPDIYLPCLPANTSEMKETELYTEEIYPVSDGVLHAWSGCPAASSIEGYGSLSQLDAGTYEECDTCQLTSSALGKVAAASSSISNGFEYHYRKVAESAEAYCEAKAEAVPVINELQDAVEGVLAELSQALEEATSCRIEAYPPGRYGAVAALYFTADAEESLSSFFASADLGSFAAVSASVMVEDANEDVLASLLDGVADDIGPPLSDASSTVLSLWSAILGAYSDGIDAVTSGVEDTLDALPLTSTSGMGSWAADALMEMLEDVGLEPANTASAKAVTANTASVAPYGDGALASVLAKTEEYESDATDVLSGIFELIGG